MDNEMIERCKAKLEECFAPAIDFRAPYAKVMRDMAIKEIIKAMREPTEKMLGVIHGCYPDIPDKYASVIAKQRWQSAIDAVIND